MWMDRDFFFGGGGVLSSAHAHTSVFFGVILDLVMGT